MRLYGYRAGYWSLLWGSSGFGDKGMGIRGLASVLSMRLRRT